MKYFHIDGIINEEMLNKFLLFCNENVGDNWTIILNSGGGKSNLSAVMLNIINARPKDICIISCGAYSAGFYLFYYATCKRKIVTNSYGMMHLSASDMRMQSNSEPAYLEDEVVFKNWKESNTDIDFCKKFMNKKELKRIKKGRDVYFTFKRMKEIFPEVEVI